MKDFSGFIAVIRELIALFEGLIPVEQEKLDAAIKNRVSFVEECMHKEQAFVLQLKGLEQRRETQQKQLDMENYSFRQILDQVPDETAVILKPLFDRLSTQIQLFQSINDSARDIIEVNLHVIRSALAKQAVEKENAGEETYSASGAKKDTHDGKHFTSRSV
ncbi:MAG TPA: flagellar protein FlgN [Lachnospiraceae bacterium]|nr:flagellar protein FlgN [Lachnospiraceae bacterium]